jgi:hypothetical protein
MSTNNNFGSKLVHKKRGERNDPETMKFLSVCYLALFTVFFLRKSDARVGFEMEFGQFKVVNRTHPSDIIPARTVIHRQDFWNVTVDEADHGNDIEIITAPFSYYSPSGMSDFTRVILFCSSSNKTHSCSTVLRKAMSDISKFICRLELTAAAAYLENTSKFELPRYVSPELYELSTRPHFMHMSAYRMTPQVTFGILPTHFHYFACDFLLQNTAESRHIRTLFLHTPSFLDVSLTCNEIDHIFSKPWFKEVPYQGLTLN